MKLSKLVFLCVKNVLYLNDSSFNYDSFLLGDFDPDPDYDTNINNVFTPLNEAIARLSDLERIPYKVVEVKFKSPKVIDANDIDGNGTSINVKETCGVGQLVMNQAVVLAHKQVGSNVLLLDNLLDRSKPVYLEYKEDIPCFDRSYIPAKNPLTGDLDYDDNGDPTPDVELKDYQISDSMCNYIIEYVQGKLQEPIEPNIANMHVTRAEAYFSNIRTVRPLLIQSVISTKYKIGE